MTCHLRGSGIRVRGGVAVLLAVAVAASLGCDRPPPAAASTTLSSAPSAAPSPGPSGSPTSSRLTTAGWASHTDTSLHLAFSYPPNWFVQPSSDPGTFNLSNEDAGAPLAMDARGVWLSIGVLRQSCANQHISGTIVSQRSTTNSGYAGTRYVTDVTAQGKFTISWLVQRGDECVIAAFLSYSQPTRDAQLGVADAVIDSITLA